MSIAVSVPSLRELPAPPPGKTGWPWTEEGRPIPDAMPDGRPWPHVSVVTPSYNQAEFLEETLRSVLLQGYPNLEYVVIDGGSRDGSVAVLQKYAAWLAHWVSEPDRGQSHAINKGFARSTGEILAWLNSDDLYYPNALRAAVEAFVEAGCDLLFGAMDKVEVDGERVRFIKRSSPVADAPFHPFPILSSGERSAFHFFQPAMFWSRRIWLRAGPLDERYHYVMDMEWCNRALAAGAKLATRDVALARFALHAGSKSQDFNHRQHWEQVKMYLRLSRTPGFRMAPCLWSALRPAQTTLTLLADKAEREGHRWRAEVPRTGARVIKAVRLWIPGLKGAETLTPTQAQP